MATDGLWDFNLSELEPYADGTFGQQGGASVLSERKRRSRVGPIYEAVAAAGVVGVTSTELEGKFGWHHGMVSGPLSILAKGGKVLRLVEVRGANNVYVVPDFQAGRSVIPFKPNKKKADIGDVLAGVDKMIAVVGEPEPGLVHGGACWLDHVPCAMERVRNLIFRIED